MSSAMTREEAVSRLKEAEKIAFFGGAGTSTESGIPDFRSSGGVYDSVPEYVLSIDCLLREPERFYSFYRKSMIFPEAKPNKGHRVLAKWEQKGRLSGIITQNIDGLHQAAGSKKVYEIHGGIRENYCMRCHKLYSVDDIPEEPIVPRCSCGGMIRPDVVLYGEALDQQVVAEALKLLTEADALIVAGTSLVVYPAAGFIRYFRGKVFIMNNKASTPLDHKADVILREGFSNAMEWLDSECMK